MTNVKASTKEEKSKVFEMILCSPGMSENCKIVLQMSRQNVLLLTRLIECGILTSKASFEDEILSSLPETSAGEFKMLHEEILRKSGLTDFYEKLKSL
jgi:hypothetical protein